jgi:hypothetical protein
MPRVRGSGTVRRDCARGQVVRERHSGRCRRGCCCLLFRSSWLTVEGDRHVGAAGVLHRRGGRAAVAVSVGELVAFPCSRVAALEWTFRDFRSQREQHCTNRRLGLPPRRFRRLLLGRLHRRVADSRGSSSPRPTRRPSMSETVSRPVGWQSIVAPNLWRAAAVSGRSKGVQRWR